MEGNNLSYMKLDITYKERFDTRHNGPDDNQVADMLKFIKADSLDHLIDETIPKSIQLEKDMNLPLAIS